MANPFGNDDMAAGYARRRPPVHPRVLEQFAQGWGWKAPFARALDVGCGAGLSTRALSGWAHRCIGLDPALSMLQWAPSVAPSAEFLVGAAEAIPLRDGAVDLITAAGSLNYADLDLFFPEAARVLRPQGVLVVYDFSPGRSFRGAPGLDEWFASFTARYPPPPHEALTLSPAILAGLDTGFRMHLQQEFEIGVMLAPDFYLDYMLTETNVAAAVRAGTPVAEIRGWCVETLAPLWPGLAREVLFRGYFAAMIPA